MLFYFLACLVLFPPLVQAADYEVVPVPAADQEKPFTYGADLDFVSRYIWRGIAYSDGPVFQPSVWVSTHGFTFTLWNNIDLTDEPQRITYNELDLYFSYSKTWEKIIFEPSVYLYIYPSQLDSPDTAEFSLKLSYPVGPIAFFTTQNVDFAAYPGAYFGEFGISFERDLLENFSLETDASFGLANGAFNDAYFEIDRAAANLFTYNLGFRYYPLEFFFLRPHMQVTALLSQTLRAQVVNATIVSGGMAVGVEF